MTPNAATWSRRAETISFARSRAQKFRDITKRREGRFAAFRLIATLLLLALFAAFFERMSNEQRVLSIILFLVSLILAAVWHRTLKSAARSWMLLENSYELSSIRLNRNMAALKEREAPWHKVLAESVPAGHPYATDLDIATGVYSLFDGCATQEGSEALLKAFLEGGINPPSAKERTLRIARVKSLSRHTDFLRRHETLRIDDEHISDYLRSQENAQTIELKSPFSPVNLALFSLAAIAGVIGWAAMLIPAIKLWWHTHNSESLFHALIAYAAIPLAGVFIFRPAIEFGQQLQRRTKVLVLLLDTVENLRTQDSFANLSCLQNEALLSFRRLRSAHDLISARNNPVVWLIAHIIAPYDAIVCVYLLVAAHKIQHHLPEWERELVEVDIVCSFARFLSENPHCRLIPEPHETPVRALRTTNLAHPILKPEVMVTNDFATDQERPLTLLTGSNMSGKSTFLRALGINQILFNLGAPVCAKAFETIPSKVLCAIRVDDSTADGMSYFYAEVKRLKSMLITLDECAVNDVSAIFLVDEIFRGTNNRERFIGSWSVLHALLHTRSIGLVSTHDLALTELESRDHRLKNMHFREHIEMGALAFDYKIKEGPCPTTNALVIMRREGLPVLDDAP